MPRPLGGKHVGVDLHAANFSHRRATRQCDTASRGSRGCALGFERTSRAPGCAPDPALLTFSPLRNGAKSRSRILGTTRALAALHRCQTRRARRTTVSEMMPI